MPSIHVPLFIQGLGSQSSILVEQLLSVKPSKHVQLKELMRSVQLPFTHGFRLHSLIWSTSHNAPVSGGEHEQLKLFVNSMHVPPFIQGSE